MPSWSRRLCMVPGLALVAALAACAGSAAPASDPASQGATAAAATATAAPSVPASMSAPDDGGAGAAETLPAGTAAAVTVRGETYTFADAATTTCTVARTVVTVTASSADPRLVLTIAWRATGGTRHVNFGNPGRPGVWQAGDTTVGASDVTFVVQGRTAEFVGLMRHTDQSVDNVTIRISC